MPRVDTNEIEKLTLAKGLGRVSVNVCYDCMLLEKEFIIKYTNGYSQEFYEKEIEKIDDYIESFSKKNNIYDFYLGCYILLK